MLHVQINLAHGCGILQAMMCLRAAGALHAEPAVQWACGPAWGATDSAQNAMLRPGLLQTASVTVLGRRQYQLLDLHTLYIACSHHVRYSDFPNFAL